MAKYNKAQGIVLKKQNYKETDQIVTIWSSEFGKIRVLAKGLRLAKSKLAYSLQDLALIEFETTGRFPSIISASVIKNYKGIRQNLAKMAPAFYAVELMLKMTADEHPNSQAFDLLSDFLDELNGNDTEFQAYTQIDIFALNLTQVLGFGKPEEIRSHRDVRNFVEEVIERTIKSEAFLISI